MKLRKTLMEVYLELIRERGFMGIIIWIARIVLWGCIIGGTLSLIFGNPEYDYTTGHWIVIILFGIVGNVGIWFWLNPAPTDEEHEELLRYIRDNKDNQN